MNEVFISYRRNDSEPLVERLLARLSRQFAHDTIFRDKYSIEPGALFPDEIKKALSQCKVMLVIMGPSWISAAGQFGRRRIDDPEDWVRLEVETALSTDRIRVIPVLIDAMPMPPASAFPDSLAALTKHNALVLHQDEAFEHDVDKLVTTLERFTQIEAKPLEPVSTQQIRSQEAQALAAADAQPQPSIKRRVKVIGGFPDYFDNNRLFHNRVMYRDTIRSFIRDRVRVVVVHGETGIGKTALVCKVVADLDQVPDMIDGVVTISGKTVDGRPNPITLDRIVSDVQKLLPTRTLDLQETNPAHQVEQLLEVTSEGNYVLLLDNFELLQDPTSGIPTNPDLETLLLANLRRGGLMIIITTQIPLSLHDMTYRSFLTHVRVEEGLPTDEALAFLAELLSDVSPYPPTDGLRRLIDLTEGRPRALAAVAGWIASYPVSPLSELIAEIEAHHGTVIYHIVGAAFASLPPAMRRVMEALSLFPAAVATRAALEYMLAPFLDMNSSPLSELLNGLKKRRQLTFDEHTHTFDLHTTDRAYARKQLPDGWGDTTTYGRYALLRRAADFYASERKPKSAWLTIDDIRPQLHEFEFLQQLREYDAAASLLTEFDFDFLLLWGYAKTVVALHEQLQGHISDARLASISAANLGAAYRRLGKNEQSIPVFEHAIHHAQQANDRSLEGLWLARLGSAYSDMGEIDEMIATYQQALPISREVGDRRGEATVLGDLGIGYRLLGKPHTALDYHQQALVISQELAASADPAVQRGGIRGVSNHLANLGMAHGLLGQLDQAIDYTQQSITASRDINYQRGEGIRTGNLGWLMAQTGDFASATTYLLRAIGGGESVGDPYYIASKGLQLGEVYLMQQQFKSAQLTLQNAHQYDVLQLNSQVAALLGVAEWGLGHHEAARTAWQAAIHAAEHLLAKTENFFEARYALGLAQAGLATLGESLIEAAAATYHRARQTCAAAGVLSQQRRWLDLLISTPNGEMLQPVRTALD